MPASRASSIARSVAVAILAPLLITLLKLSLFESLGQLPFLLYFVSVVVATWLGGSLAGAISTLFAVLAAAHFFLPNLPVQTVSSYGRLRLITFVIEALLIVYLTARLRRVRAQSAGAMDEAKLAVAKLEGVLAGVRHGIAMQDERGELVYANDAAAQLIGVPTAKELMALPLAHFAGKYEMRTADGSPFPIDQMPGRRVLRGEAPHAEAIVRYLRRLDGNETWTRIRATEVRLPGGEVPYAVNVIEDLTEARAREEAVRAEDRQRAFLHDAARELNSSLDYRQTLSAVARLAVPAIADWCVVDLWEGPRLTRFAAEHVDPSKRELLWEMDRRFPLALDATGGRAEALRGDAPVGVPVVRDDEIERYAQNAEHAAMLRQLKLHGFLVVPLRVQGSTLGLISLIMAESERVHDEHDLRLAIELAERAGLAVAHARAYAAAEQARLEAEQANATKDEFLAMLGHELRNPLAPIVTAVHLMKMRRADLFERERTIIERQVKHLVTLVDDLLDVSRITRGKVEISKEPLDLNDTVARAMELAAPLIEQRKHAVVLEMAPMLMVDGDAVRLSQGIANLLTNAAKYTPPGGHLTVRGSREDGQLVLRVRDDGVGIEPELLPRVFDLFVQGRQNLDRAAGGLGLGLAIVKGVVELHGGSVSAQSDGAQRGSEFTIRLPPGVLRKRSSIPAPAHDAPIASRARVMVVDDNTDALATLSDALRVHGHEVHTAEDAASALALAQRTEPELAVLDIGLPGMDGYELARRLRQLPGFANIKLVAVTGYGQASDKERAREAGFDDHLVKPVTVQALRSVLDRLTAPAVDGS
ncbi:MAG TPA: ATP-binding protein [Polyangiales bacterium]|nr:ATP-binding protein [Polyangiales bacterium]